MSEATQPQPEMPQPPPQQTDADPFRELQERLGPQFENAQAQLQQVNERVKDFVKKNPGTTLLGAAVVGFLVEVGGTPMIDESAPPTESPPILHTVAELAKDANSALNGMSDAVGLTDQVEKAPYAMIAAALGIGYIVGGGLFTPTTTRLVRLGMKFAAIPQVRDRLLDVAESALDGVLANGKKS